MKIIGQFRKYVGTFTWLTWSQIHNNRVTTILCIAVLCVAAFAYPFPILLFMAAIFAASKGQSEISQSFQDNVFSIPILYAIIIAIGLAIITYALNFITVSKIIRLNIEWQTVLFKKILKSDNRPTDLSSTQSARAPLSISERVGQASRLTGAAALIGRLLSNGLYNAVVFFVAFSFVLIIDYRFTGLIVGLSLFLLPIYAKVFGRISNVRTQQIKQRNTSKSTLFDAFEIYYIRKHDSLGDNFPEFGASFYEPFYAIANHQYLSLNSTRLLIGVHCFIILAALILIVQPQVGGISQKEFLLFAGLLIMVRGGTGLLSLMANLTRNYENLRNLRNFFIVPPEQIAWTGGAENEVSLVSDPNKILQAGQLTLIEMPRPFKMIDQSNFVKSILIHESTEAAGKTKLWYCLDQAQCVHPIPKNTGLILIEREAWQALEPADQGKLLLYPAPLLIRVPPSTFDKRFSGDVLIAITNKCQITDLMPYSEYKSNLPEEFVLRDYFISGDALSKAPDNALFLASDPVRFIKPHEVSIIAMDRPVYDLKISNFVKSVLIQKTTEQEGRTHFWYCEDIGTLKEPVPDDTALILIEYSAWMKLDQAAQDQLVAYPAPVLLRVQPKSFIGKLPDDTVYVLTDNCAVTDLTTYAEYNATLPEELVWRDYFISGDALSKAPDNALFLASDPVRFIKPHEATLLIMMRLSNDMKVSNFMKSVLVTKTSEAAGRIQLWYCEEIGQCALPIPKDAGLMLIEYKIWHILEQAQKDRLLAYPVPILVRVRTIAAGKSFDLGSPVAITENFKVIDIIAK